LTALYEKAFETLSRKKPALHAPAGELPLAGGVGGEQLRSGAGGFGHYRTQDTPTALFISTAA
jgi:hypothetical protein